jgi:hypothetical protein
MERTSSKTPKRRKHVVLQVRKTSNRCVNVERLARIKTEPCKGCGYPVSAGCGWCGECICEEDGL